MRITFVMNLWLENVGIMQVMPKLIEDGHEVSLAISIRPSRLMRQIVALRPDVLAFSLTTNNYRWAVDLAAAVRQRFPAIRIMAGGPHPTLFPTFCEETEIDAVCIGEGEVAFAEWVRDIDQGGQGHGIRNIGSKVDGKLQYPEIGPLIDPLDNTPFAHRDLFHQYRFFKNSPFKSFLASRGCNYGCRFCYNSRFKEIFKDAGTYRRIMSPERVVEEVEHVCREHATRLIIFEDDCFPSTPEWLEMFVRLYRDRVGLPFVMNSRADMLNEDNVRLYKEAGVSTVAIGVQSGNEERRMMQLGTGVRDETLMTAAEMLHRHEIPFLTYNMFGLPGETADDVYETILLNRRIGVTYGRFVMFQPYPGLRLTEEHGLSKAIDHDSTTVYYRSATSGGEVPEIVNMQNFSNWLIRHEKNDRLMRFLARLPPNPAYKAFFWYTFLSGLRSRLRISWGELFRLFWQNLR